MSGGLPLRLASHCRLLLACWLAVLGSMALAQAAPDVPLLDLSRMAQAADTSSPGLVTARVVEGLSLNTGPEQVLSLPPSAFNTHDSFKTYALGSSSQTWFWFRVAADRDAAQHAWHLIVGKPYLDRAALHHRGDDGRWLSVAAGDSLPNTVWPLRSLSPQFVLPNAGRGTNDYLLSINGDRPMSLAPRVQRGDLALADMQLDFLFHGIFLGGVVLALFLSIAFALSYRDARYAWYALYVFTASMAVAAHYGVGARLIWPHSPEWLHHMTLTFAHIASIVQLQFCRSMFLDRHRSPSLWWITAVVIAVAAVIAVVSPGIQSIALMSGLFMASVATILGLTVVIVALALKDRRQAAYFWLIAYIPLIVLTALTVVSSMGFVRFAWLPTQAVMLGVMFEIPVLLIALHLHGKHVHAVSVRSSTLAQLDPLTGFVIASQFDAVGDAAARAALKGQTACVVAMVRVLPAEYQDASGPEDRLKRIVRTLNTVAQEGDTVVRLGEDLFALVILTASSRRQAAVRLSRLVALGLMERGSSQGKAPLVLRVMAGVFDPRKLTWRGFRSELTLRMSAADAWGNKSIRFVPIGEPQNDADDTDW